MAMNPRNNPPQFEFADDSPTPPGRKHRRGRYTPNRKNAATANGKASANSPNSSRGGSADNNSSFRSGGHKFSSAASRAQASSLSPQPQHQRLNLNLQQKPPTNYNFTDSTPTKNSTPGKDDNSCTGSLTYSASSSVRSEESSNESSFADILKVIDSDGDGATEVKEFMAKQSKAASYGCYSATGGGQIERDGASTHAAVQGWKQRQAAAQQQMKQAARGKGQKKKFTMAASKHVPTNPNVDLNYSKDDSSGSGDMFGVDFDENVLETIAGHDDDVARHTQAAVSSNSTTPADHPFRDKEPYQTSSTFISNNDVSSAPSSPRSRNTGHVTPPPNSRHKRTSTPPGAINSISRTNSRGSRHSKSSSDGSWDTPAPSSPPMKPPHVRSTPVSKTNRKSRSDEKASSVVADPNEAFYAKSWMCGFADAFNFDGFDTFQK